MESEGLRSVCPRCGAKRRSAGIGLEPTLAEYLDHMRAVGRELWRVLHPSGTLWLNMGDCYWGAGGANNHSGITGRNIADGAEKDERDGPRAYSARWGKNGSLKPKDLVGLPWRVAFALQEDGWYLRSDVIEYVEFYCPCGCGYIMEERIWRYSQDRDIIWAKPNPMPESVRDRPTKAHEYLFLFAKGDWKTRIVELSRLPGDLVHFGKHLGAQHPSSGDLAELCVRLASAIFDAAQLKGEFSLPPFYAEIWKKRADGSDSDFVRGLPVEHRATVLAARLLDADATTKEFLCKLYGLGITLTDSDNLLIGGGMAEVPLPPGILRHGDTAIGVHGSGKVCKLNLLHGHIILQSSAACHYYYDAEAVREENVGKFNNFPSHAKIGNGTGRARYDPAQQAAGPSGHVGVNRASRNRRTVWTIPTKPYKGAHFATFPPALVEPCILAGTQPGDMVLDPFCGSGTVGEVAQKFGRRFVGMDLSVKYLELARERIAKAPIGMAL